MYNYLLEFNTENKHFKIPSTSENKKLILWIRTQRNYYKNKKLSSERIIKLNSIDFEWKIKSIRKENEDYIKFSNDDKWNEMFQDLVNYYHKNKTFVLPADEEFGVLKRWCLTQRTKNNKNILLQERFIKLDDLGFPWKENRGRKKTKEPIKNTYFNDQWEIMYNILFEFYKENKHFKIPLTIENKKLILWLKTQRYFYKNEQLSSDRIIKLNTINFPWLSNGKEFINPVNQRDDSNWLKMFNQLFSFIIKHNHTVIPRGDIETKSLALWLMKQRKSYRDGKLSNEQIEKLKRINVDLAYNRKQGFENIWIRHYENLVLFKEINGHCNPSAMKPNEKSLGTWVLFQRMNRKKNVLENFKIELLNKINFVWDTEMFKKNLKQNDNIWLEKYAKLLEFQKIHNSTIVPQLNNEIGRWVNDQRVNFKRNKLSEFRIGKLNDIGFVWDVKNLKK